MIQKIKIIVEDPLIKSLDESIVHVYIYIYISSYLTSLLIFLIVLGCFHNIQSFILKFLMQACKAHLLLQNLQHAHNTTHTARSLLPARTHHQEGYVSHLPPYYECRDYQLTKDTNDFFCGRLYHLLLSSHMTWRTGR